MAESVDSQSTHVCACLATACKVENVHRKLKSRGIGEEVDSGNLALQTLGIKQQFNSQMWCEVQFPLA